jgi:hypothetical protein
MIWSFDCLDSSAFNEEQMLFRVGYFLKNPSRFSKIVLSYKTGYKRFIGLIMRSMQTINKHSCTHVKDTNGQIVLEGCGVPAKLSSFRWAPQLSYVSPSLLLVRAFTATSTLFFFCHRQRFCCQDYLDAFAKRLSTCCN